MILFASVWFCDFLCVIGALASVRMDWDDSVESYAASEKSGRTRFDANYRRKYGLRFHPTTIKRRSESVAPNVPTAIGPDFNFEEFLATLGNLPNRTGPHSIHAAGHIDSHVTIATLTEISDSNTIAPTTDPAFTNIVPPFVSNFATNQTFPHPIATAATPLTGLLHTPHPLHAIPTLPVLAPILPNIPIIPHIPINNEFVQSMGALLPSRPLPPPIVANIVPPPGQSQRFPNMLALIGNRMKNLFFGPGPTFIKRPQGGRGFLNLFDVIKFKNGPCTGVLNRIRPVNGTCFHQSECMERSGIITGSCADGYGVCCVFKYGCGTQTQAEVSYLESPNYPLATSQPLNCAFTIYLQPEVRQLKLDLLFFELKQPLSGDCVDDQFIVSGHNKNFIVPVLCGINSGQHMYVDVDETTERKLDLSIIGRSTGQRAFSIRATQLRDNLAPKYCLQYFTEPSGYIKSFNYDNVGQVVEGRAASYLNNMNYAICIERMPDKCQITYTNQVTEGELPFQLVNVNEQFVPLSPPGQAGADIFSCPDDFIAINAVHLCGDKLNDGSISQNYNENAPITEYSTGPIVIPFQTDEQVVGRGFQLIYYQESC